MSSLPITVRNGQVIVIEDTVLFNDDGTVKIIERTVTVKDSDTFDTLANEADQYPRVAAISTAIDEWGTR